jgi:hypothetical protein
MNRRPRSALSIIAILAFVFAQMVGAAHACQVGFGGQVEASKTAPCCDSEQPGSQNQCDNHCQLADKAPDRVQVAAPAPAAIAGSVMLTRAAPRSNAPPSSFLAPDLGRHIEPSISIRNCCFRI